MAKSKVYFTNFRATPDMPLLKKFRRLIEKAGIKEMDMWEQGQMRKSETLWGQLMTRPDCTFVVHTPYGNFHIPPQMAKEMLSGEKQTVVIGDEEYSCQELLDQKIVGAQEDIFNHRLIRLVTIEPEYGLHMQ